LTFHNVGLYKNHYDYFEFYEIPYTWCEPSLDWSLEKVKEQLGKKLMNIDTFNQIGNSHKMCEDYVISGKLTDEISCAIVCDGCSSSKNTDVGARLLAYSTFEILKKYFNGCLHESLYNKNTIGILNYRHELSEHFYSLAFSTGMNLGFNEHSTFLDTTLIILLSDRKNNIVVVYGDGNIFIKYKSGDTKWMNIEYSSGAPYYLSYDKNLFSKRADGYKKAFGNEKLILSFKDTGFERIRHNYKFNDLTSKELNALSTFSFPTIEHDGDTIESISIASDGVQSFIQNDKSISMDRVVNELTSFRNYNGVFLERRMNKMLKSFEKEGIKNYDDISVATINLTK